MELPWSRLIEPSSGRSDDRSELRPLSCSVWTLFNAIAGLFEYMCRPAAGTAVEKVDVLGGAAVGADH